MNIYNYVTYYVYFISSKIFAPECYSTAPPANQIKSSHIVGTCTSLNKVLNWQLILHKKNEAACKEI